MLLLAVFVCLSVLSIVITLQPPNIVTGCVFAASRSLFKMNCLSSILQELLLLINHLKISKFVNSAKYIWQNTFGKLPRLFVCELFT